MNAPITSESVGDPQYFLSLNALREAYAALPPAPRDVGRVHLLVARGEGGLRSTPTHVHLTPKNGIPGDAWGSKRRSSCNGQLTVIQRDVLELIANGQPLVLSGDNIVIELDLTAASLPIGTTLKAGTATLVVTPKPHNGCSKFQARFGADALKFVSRKPTRALNLRGVYMRVTRSGDVKVGDQVRVMKRPDQV